VYTKKKGGVVKQRYPRLVALSVLTLAVGALGACGTNFSLPTSPAPSSVSTNTPSVTATAESPSPSVTATAATDSPSPGVTESPSPGVTDISPSPSTSTASDSLDFNNFVHDVRPVRHRYRVLEDAIDYAIWTRAHKYIDASWPPAGRKVYSLLSRYDEILVDLQLISTPPFIQPAFDSLLKGLRLERQEYHMIAGWLVNKSNWASGSANGRAYESINAKATAAFDYWRVQMKFYEKSLGVHIPWNWSKE
jgi:hypothetical protein